MSESLIITHFIPWKSTGDNLSDIVSENLIAIDNVDNAPYSPIPKISLFCINQTTSGTTKYSCMSTDRLCKCGAHCSSNGIQLAKCNRFGQMFFLHKSALWSTKLPHCGPLPMCSKSHALNRITAASDGVTRRKRPTNRRRIGMWLRFSRSRDSD